MLRSATASVVQPHAAEMAVEGSFIELRSDDSGGKPWLARVVATRRLPGVVGGRPDEIDEVECEWLWHPAESIKDFGLSEDPNVYGLREVFLGGGGGESTVDWNPNESIKYRVYVIPLEVYKTVAAAGFQMQLIAGDPSSITILDASRCWYYRQTFNAELKTLAPPLPLTVHRPNPLFHQWCNQNGRPVTLPTTRDEQGAPQRTILVPENPERMYFYCTDCQRRFETRQGDCIEIELLEDPKMHRFKSDINTPDVLIKCPYCKAISGEDVAPPSKRARLGSANELWGSFDAGEDQV